MEKTDYEFNEISPTIWQNMRECIAMLANANTSADIKNQVGEKLLQQISSFENKDMFNINKDTNASLQREKVQNNMQELRQHVYGTEEKVKIIGDKLFRIDGNCQTLNSRMSVVEGKLQRMENVNSNFRKILKLENEFLRELSRADNATIVHLHKKLQLLRTKLEDITRQTSPGSLKTVALNNETRFDEFDDMLNPESASRLAVSKSSVGTSPIVVGISELMSRGFTKDNILELFRGIRNPEINN